MYGRTVKTFDETTIIHMYERQLMGAIIMGKRPYWFLLLQRSYVNVYICVPTSKATVSCFFVVLADVRLVVPTNCGPQEEWGPYWTFPGER